MSRACGLSRKAIAKGIQEIESGTALAPGRVRQAGAGRRRITDHDPRLVSALERLIDPDTRGDPESPLRWTCKSTRTLAAQLTRQRHPISHMKVAQLLHAARYSLQGNLPREVPSAEPPKPRSRTSTSQVSWAELMKRTLGINPLLCPVCQATMTLLAVITKQDVILKVLSHLNVPRYALTADEPSVAYHDMTGEPVAAVAHRSRS